MTGTAIILRGNVSSIVTLLAGLFFFLSIPGQIAVFENDGLSGASARTMPYLIASAIIILSLFMIVFNTIANLKAETGSSGNEPREKTSYSRVFLAFGVIALWIMVLPYLGFNITTMMLVASIMFNIGDCRWWQIVVLSLVLSFPINYLLAIVLRVHLPSGSIFG